MRLIIFIFTFLSMTGCTQFSNNNPAALLITNTRIITGTGTVLNSSSVLVHEGRILQISQDAEATKRQFLALSTAQEGRGREIDGNGMTLMPGLIDTHRHLPRYGEAFTDLLREGVTTVMDMAAWQDEILSFKEAIATGQLEGPRVLAVGPAFTTEQGWPVSICRRNPQCLAQFVVTTDDPAALRERIQQLAGSGADAIKVMYQNNSAQGPGVTDEMFRIISEEAHKQGLDVVVHSESVNDMLQAIALGADRFVHSPLVGQVAGTDLAAQLVAGNIPMVTTVSWQTEASQAAIGQANSPENKARLENVLTNIRNLWDDGVVVAFGTDSPTVLNNTEFMVEVEALKAVLSREEIITALTYNAAKYLELEQEIGTLEPGKQADLVMLSGNPLDDLEHLRDVVLVIKAGKVVFNNL